MAMTTALINIAPSARGDCCASLILPGRSHYRSHYHILICSEGASALEMDFRGEMQVVSADSSRAIGPSHSPNLICLKVLGRYREPRQGRKRWKTMCSIEVARSPWAFGVTDGKPAIENTCPYVSVYASTWIWTL